MTTFQMMKTLLLLSLLTLGISAQDTLRISKVAKEATEDTERMLLRTTLDDGDIVEEELLINKKAVITEADIEQARPQPSGSQWEVQITLTEDGGRQMEKATEKLKFGNDRLAVIVEGRVQMAPVVNSALGKKLVITGQNSLQEAADLARKLEPDDAKAEKDKSDDGEPE